MQFQIIKRNYGHWDICNSEKGRLFRIRGTPGNFVAMDEREKPQLTKGFKTVGACLAFIMDELMFEEIVADPTSPGNNKLIYKL